MCVCMCVSLSFSLFFPHFSLSGVRSVTVGLQRRSTTPTTTPFLTRIYPSARFHQLINEIINQSKNWTQCQTFVTNGWHQSRTGGVQTKEKRRSPAVVIRRLAARMRYAIMNDALGGSRSATTTPHPGTLSSIIGVWSRSTAATMATASNYVVNTVLRDNPPNL